MKKFNDLEEMQAYFNKESNTYNFLENGDLLDVWFDFRLVTDANIKAGDIRGLDIQAGNINAGDINAKDICCGDIEAENISSRNIKALDITALDINAWNIKAEDIEARDINSRGIQAGDIDANDINSDEINAGNIDYWSVCFACRAFTCKSVSSSRKNSKHFCLDSEIVFKAEESK